VQLVQLDLGGNRALDSLDGIDRLPRLRILFASGCGLADLPPHGPLSRAQLSMLALKANGMTLLDGDALPATLVWFIAANNAIRAVRAPHRLQKVRKLMLSHNALTTEALEPLIDAASSLEMLRVACNKLETLPAAIGRHPKLAWLAIGGNPYAQRQLEARCARAQDSAASEAASEAEGAPLLLASSESPELAIGEEVLGRGSGATVVIGSLRGLPVAVKLWTAAHFSDGDARGEWEMGRLTGACTHVVRTLAVFQAPQLGMVLELLDGASAAGGPPSFDSVTRDALDTTAQALALADALRVAREVGSALAWLHSRGLMHGDIYLHNTLLCFEHPPPAGERRVSAVRLSDFGAAACYSKTDDGHALERVEVRSFGYLLDDLAILCRSTESASAPDVHIRNALAALAERCCTAESEQAPGFAQIVDELEAIGAVSLAL